MRALGLALALLALAACGRAQPPPPGPAGQAATIVVSVPEGGAPNGGIVRVRATKEGLADLELEVPVARHASRAAVLGAFTFLMPGEWQAHSYAAGDALVIEEIETVDVDAGETGIDLALTVTRSPPPGYGRR